MKIRKASKYALMPHPGQEQNLARFAGSCRFTWNRVLALQKERLARGEKVLSYAEACRLLPTWKKNEGTSFLAEAPTHPLQQTLKDLDRALRNAFDRNSPKRFPRFKKKGKSLDSFRYPDPKQFRVDAGNGRVFLPKLGWLRYRNSLRLEGDPKQITVSRSAGRWFVSVQVEVEIGDPVHPSPSRVGIDLGVASFATLSDGSKIEALNSFKRLEKTLARAQRNLARKTKFSSNWQKQKRRIAAIHHRIACARQDFLHKQSSMLVKNHGLIALEGLNVQKMSASAQGSIEEPGRNVQAKSGLNKAILDQGWGEFRRQLAYKAAWQGGAVVEVNPRHTSQRCHACGHVTPENRPTQARFRCVCCGHSAHADVNAAQNILAAGLAASACGGAGLPVPSKQEPSVSAVHSCAA